MFTTCHVTFSITVPPNEISINCFKTSEHPADYPSIGPHIRPNLSGKRGGYTVTAVDCNPSLHAVLWVVELCVTFYGCNIAESASISLPLAAMCIPTLTACDHKCEQLRAGQDLHGYPYCHLWSSSLTAMKDLKHNPSSLLPQPQNAAASISQRKRQKSQIVYDFLILVLACGIVLWTISFLSSRNSQTAHVQPFFWTANKPTGVCTGENGKGTSYSGHIGLKGDSEELPKRCVFFFLSHYMVLRSSARSFYWCATQFVSVFKTAH